MQQPSETRQRVEDLIGKGLTVREVADVIGISTQRVYQHLDKLGMKPAQKVAS